jgi:hypothetical protein
MIDSKKNRCIINFVSEVLNMEEQGKRFSLVYLERGTPARDSQRFRNRLAAYYWEHLLKQDESIRKAFQREAGIEVPSSSICYITADVFKGGELRDVLDGITIVYQALIADGWRQAAENWRLFVARALREENVGYLVDAASGVHYFVDEEFERNRASTLSVLNIPRYAGVRAALEDAYRHMDNDPPDTKATVRSIFEALEIQVKQMVETKNLNRWVVENKLKERCLELFGGDPVAEKAVSHLFDSFADWVDALHNYRHGQATEEPVAPNEPMTVHILSTGCSYIRWLVQMDISLNAK